MAEQYDDTNRGALFKNDKEGNEARPDYRGPLNVEGKEWRVAAWLKESKKGDKYMSLSIEPPYEGGASKPAAPAANLPEPEDIPF